MSLNLGINVVEVEGRAVPSIQAAPTSVAGFIIRAPRGVPGQVYRISNWTQFLDRFGGFTADAYGAYAMRGFLDSGGTVAYVTRVVSETGGTAAAASTKTFDDGAGAALTVAAGAHGEDNPGAWGDDIGIRIAANPDVSGTYDLFVSYKGETVETWKQLNNSTAAGAPGKHPEDVINHELTGSEYVTVSEDATDNPAPTPGTTFVSLEDGANGGPPTATEFAGALPLFDIHPVQLVCCPETDGADLVNAALTHCETHGDRMFVGHVPFDNDAAEAKTYAQAFQADKRYGALYFPWILVSDPLGTRRWIPPTGHILGVYGRTERERGIWKAPAGNAARVNGALDVKEHITDVDHTELVKNGSVNAVRFISGQGIVVDSSRTLSTDTRWLYVNVRLLFNFVKSSLKAGLRWVVQEPNDNTLWDKVKFNSVTPFLMGLWRRGAFGPGAPEDVFTVKIDAENNPPASIQQGILTVEVTFYPSRPAETIVIRVGQQEGGASASEA